MQVPYLSKYFKEKSPWRSPVPWLLGLSAAFAMATFGAAMWSAQPSSLDDGRVKTEFIVRLYVANLGQDMVKTMMKEKIPGLASKMSSRGLDNTGIDGQFDSRAFWDDVKETVVDPVKENVVDPAKEGFEEHVQPELEKVGDKIKEGGEKALDKAEELGKVAFEKIKEGVNYVKEMAEKILAMALDELNKFLNMLMKKMRELLDLKDWYTLNVRTLCSGKLADKNNPNSTMTVGKCTEPGNINLLGFLLEKIDKLKEHQWLEFMVPLLRKPFEELNEAINAAANLLWMYLLGRAICCLLLCLCCIAFIFLYFFYEPFYTPLMTKLSWWLWGIAFGLWFVPMLLFGAGYKMVLDKEREREHGFSTKSKVLNYQLIIGDVYRSRMVIPIILYVITGVFFIPAVVIRLIGHYKFKRFAFKEQPFPPDAGYPPDAGFAQQGAPMGQAPMGQGQFPRSDSWGSDTTAAGSSQGDVPEWKDVNYKSSQPPMREKP